MLIKTVAHGTIYNNMTKDKTDCSKSFELTQVT